MRITVSERALNQGGVEKKLRREQEKGILPVDSVVANIKSSLEVLESEINSKVTPVEYNG